MGKKAMDFFAIEWIFSQISAILHKNNIRSEEKCPMK